MEEISVRVHASKREPHVDINYSNFLRVNLSPRTDDAGVYLEYKCLKIRKFLDLNNLSINKR